MTRKQQRIYAICLVLFGFALATTLTLFALRDTVTFFYSPSAIKGVHATFVVPERPFRLGGLVVYGTIEKHGKITTFVVTDNIEDVNVSYTGIVPDLFREGQGIVATGTLDKEGTFVASQLLAKHDENYMPPEVARMLEESKDSNASESSRSPENSSEK